MSLWKFRSYLAKRITNASKALRKYMGEQGPWTNIPLMDVLDAMLECLDSVNTEVPKLAVMAQQELVCELDQFLRPLQLRLARVEYFQVTALAIRRRAQILSDKVQQGLSAEDAAALLEEGLSEEELTEAWEKYRSTEIPALPLLSLQRDYTRPDEVIDACVDHLMANYTVSSGQFEQDKERLDGFLSGWFGKTVGRAPSLIEGTLFWNLYHRRRTAQEEAQEAEDQSE